jgi:hypothetical protein
MPNIIDKRKENWRVIIAHTECPFVTYPRSDIACEILEKRKMEGHWLNPDSSTYCCYENCPRREI